jgi:hypothetical protein
LKKWRIGQVGVAGEGVNQENASIFVKRLRYPDRGDKAQNQVGDVASDYVHCSSFLNVFSFIQYPEKRAVKPKNERVQTPRVTGNWEPVAGRAELQRQMLR